MERLAKWRPYPGTKPDTDRRVLVNFQRTLRDGTLEKSVPLWLLAALPGGMANRWLQLKLQ